MAKKNKDRTDRQPEPQTEPVAEDVTEQTEAVPETPAEEEIPAEPDRAAELQRQLDEEHDRFLRLAAEYDNFRKRSRKEKEDLYTDVKADTVAKFLPVFDNLQRALANETEDEAYKKGVELIMAELRKIMTGLGVEEFGQTGEPFDPNSHNAVMHVDSEELGENVIAQVFQKGFRIGEKVIRHAVVQVAN